METNPENRHKKDIHFKDTHIPINSDLIHEGMNNN